MTNDEMLSLEEGATVIYNGSLDNHYDIIKGHLLTRSESWLDDDHTICFSYTTSSGSKIENFFSADDIDVKG